MGTRLAPHLHTTGRLHSWKGKRWNVCLVRGRCRHDGSGRRGQVANQPRHKPSQTRIRHHTLLSSHAAPHRVAKAPCKRHGSLPATLAFACWEMPMPDQQGPSQTSLPRQPTASPQPAQPAPRRSSLPPLGIHAFPSSVICGPSRECSLASPRPPQASPGLLTGNQQRDLRDCVTGPNRYFLRCATAATIMQPGSAGPRLPLAAL